MAYDRCKRPPARAVRFFFEHAGYSTPPGRQAVAKQLARAECVMQSHGWWADWQYDQDPDLSWMTPEEHRRAHDVLCVTLRKYPGNTTFGTALAGPLCGIVDPDGNYRRVVTAELALEAIAARTRRARADRAQWRREQRERGIQRPLMGRSR